MQKVLDLLSQGDGAALGADRERARLGAHRERRARSTGTRRWPLKDRCEAAVAAFRAQRLGAARWTSRSSVAEDLPPIEVDMRRARRRAAQPAAERLQVHRRGQAHRAHAPSWTTKRRGASRWRTTASASRGATRSASSSASTGSTTCSRARPRARGWGCPSPSASCRPTAGSITVDSEVGQRPTFTLHLPGRPRPEPWSEKPRILVVEDDLSILTGLSMNLTLRGLRGDPGAGRARPGSAEGARRGARPDGARRDAARAERLRGARRSCATAASPPPVVVLSRQGPGDGQDRRASTWAPTTTW